MAVPPPTDLAPFVRPREIERRELVRCKRPGCPAVLGERLAGGIFESLMGTRIEPERERRDGRTVVVSYAYLTCPTCGEVRKWRL